MAMFELALGVFLLAAGTVAIGRKLRKHYRQSARYLASLQDKNRQALEAAALVYCKEHRRGYRQTELVRRGSTLYCPDCYMEYMLRSDDRPDVVTELGDLLGEEKRSTRRFKEETARVPEPAKK